MSRKEYHESRCKKAVAKRIVKEWREQTPPGRFLQQDPKTEKWYEIKESKIMEKTCQALRDMKRERGPAGVKHGISDRMVDPWDRSAQPHMNGPMHQHQHMNGPMPGQPMPLQGHHPYAHHTGAPWMGQPSMYPPHQMMQGGGGAGMMTPQMAPYVPIPPPAMPMGTPAGMGQGPPAAIPESVNKESPTHAAEAATEKMGDDKPGEQQPIATVQEAENIPKSLMEEKQQPSPSFKEEIEPVTEMEVEQVTFPPPDAASVPNETTEKAVEEEPPAPVETAASEAAPFLMSVDKEEMNNSPETKEEPKVDEESALVETVVPQPELDVSVPEPDKLPEPSKMKEHEEKEEMKTPVETSELPPVVKEKGTEKAATQPAEEDKTEDSRLQEESKKFTSPEEKSTPTEEKAADVSTGETTPKEDEKKEGDKAATDEKDDNRKKGELEAAALLANMFR